MSIVRGPRLERDFTVLSNAVLRDRRLSYKARGLLSCLLSQPPGYSVSAIKLAEAAPEGRTSVASGLRELEDAGYLRRATKRRPDGTFEPISIVYESPNQADQPTAENLHPVPPAETRESAGQTDGRKPARGEPADKDQERDVEEPNEVPGAALESAAHSPEVDDLCNQLADAIGNHNAPRPKVSARWRRDMRLLLERGPLKIDEPEPQTAAKISQSIGFLFTHLADPTGRDGFCWADQIRSPGALRDHWVQLRLAARRLAGASVGQGGQAVERAAARLAGDAPAAPQQRPRLGLLPGGATPKEETG